jgi:hypothetical protein
MIRSTRLFSLISIAFLVACGSNEDKLSSTIENQRKSLLALRGAWIFSQAHCDNGNSFVLKYSDKTGKFDIFYEFSNSSSGSISIVKDLDFSMSSNYYGSYNSPSFDQYSLHTLFSSLFSSATPAHAKSIKATIPLNLSYASTGVLVASSSNEAAQCTTDQDQVFPCSSTADHADVRAKYEFSGVPSVKNNILSITGSFSADLFNCDTTGATKVGPTRFEFNK